MEFIQSTLAFVVTLGVLVTIHEWGHFYVARLCGVKVLRFSVGFGKVLFSRTDRQGTEFALAAIPLGGYVKMLDEREGDVPEAQLCQTFNRKNVWQRIAIVAAGPVVNLLFAVLAYWVLFGVGVSSVAPVIGGVKEASVAAQIELPLHAEIVAVDGRETLSWQDVNLALAKRIGESGSIRLTLLGGEGRDSFRRSDYTLNIDRWQLDLENTSPVAGLGLIPYRPIVAPLIGRVVEGERADQAGIRAGDLIVDIQGQPVATWQELVAIVQSAAEQPLELGVERNHQYISMVVTPALKRLENGQSIGLIGAGVTPPQWPESMLRTKQQGIGAALLTAVDKTWNMITLTLDSIVKMIEGIISVKNLSGPITIAKVASASAASGLESYLSFLAYLSISLGVLNLLPIPMLDGGHLLFYALEVLRGKPVTQKFQDLGLRLGMFLLFSMMAIAIFNDFMRL